MGTGILVAKFGVRDDVLALDGRIAFVGPVSDLNAIRDVLPKADSGPHTLSFLKEEDVRKMGIFPLIVEIQKGEVDPPNP